MRDIFFRKTGAFFLRVSLPTKIVLFFFELICTDCKFSIRIYSAYCFFRGGLSSERHTGKYV